MITLSFAAKQTLSSAGLLMSKAVSKYLYQVAQLLEEQVITSLIWSASLPFLTTFGFKYLDQGPLK